MSKDQNSAQDFDRIFQEKLGGHSVAPPAGMWENINANTQDSKRRRGLLWIIANDTTIMLLILLLSIFSFAGGDLSNSLTASESATSSESLLHNETTGNSESASLKEEVSSVVENFSSIDNDDESELVAAELNSNNSDSYATDSGEKTNAEVTRETSNPTSKRLSSNSSNSGKSGSRNNHEEKKTVAKADEASPENSKSQPNNSDDALASNSTTNSGLETANKVSSNSTFDPANMVESTISDAQKEPFKLRLINVIKPDLSMALSEDSLSKVAAPASPQDLVGSRDHEVFAGAHVNFNLPLIFNQNTYGAFDGKELAYKPTFGLASGVRLGYTYKRQYGFQTGFIFYSSQGQKYDDKLNGNVAKRQVKLQYMQVPIILRYKFKIKKQQKFESPWVINLGTQIGILQSAQITYDGNEYPLGAIINPEANDKDYFKPIDVSVVLGVEKEIYFTNWLMLSVGMRTAFSGDINAKDHPVQNDGKNYDKSHNFTFGFTLGLNYYLRR